VRERTIQCLAGLATIAMGLFPVLQSFNVIESDDSDFGAPRWFVASIGHLFMLVGVWLALTRAPDWPLTALLRILIAPLLHALCSGFCLAVVLEYRRVQAGSTTRAMFLVLAVLFALAAGRALGRAVAGARRQPRGRGTPEP
jgi:hypothetical protein